MNPTPTPAAAGAETERGPIPYERFHSVNEERNTLRAERETWLAEKKASEDRISRAAAIEDFAERHREKFDALIAHEDRLRALAADQDPTGRLERMVEEKFDKLQQDLANERGYREKYVAKQASDAAVARVQSEFPEIFESDNATRAFQQLAIGAGLKQERDPAKRQSIIYGAAKLAKELVDHGRRSAFDQNSRNQNAAIPNGGPPLFEGEDVMPETRDEAEAYRKKTLAALMSGAQA